MFKRYTSICIYCSLNCPGSDELELAQTRRLTVFCVKLTYNYSDFTVNAELRVAAADV